MRNLSIGADIGGSHIAAMAVDLESAELLKETESRCSVDSKGTSADILSAWNTAIAGTMAKSSPHNVNGIGFAMPGPFDYPNGIALFEGVGKFDSLYRINVRHEISRQNDLMEALPVRFLNDATCFAIGEAWLGEASGYKRVMAITLGTGFGSAFLEDGVPIETGSKVPLHGWVYHLPFGDSIADDHFSTRWFIRQYRELTGQNASGVLELSGMYHQDLAVQRIFHTFGTNLGGFLAPLIHRFGADCLVIGGSIANAYDRFKDPFSEGLENAGFGNLHVYISSMGEDAAIAGSAKLSDDGFYQRVGKAALR